MSRVQGTTHSSDHRAVTGEPMVSSGDVTAFYLTQAQLEERLKTSEGDRRQLKMHVKDLEGWTISVII